MLRFPPQKHNLGIFAITNLPGRACGSDGGTDVDQEVAPTAPPPPLCSCSCSTNPFSNESCARSDVAMAWLSGSPGALALSPLREALSCSSPSFAASRKRNCRYTWLELFIFFLLLSHPSLRDLIALTAAPSPWSLDESPASVIDTLGRDRSCAVRRGNQRS